MNLEIRRRVAAPISAVRLRPLVRRTLREVKKNRKKLSDLSVVFVSDQSMRLLNRRFRKIDAPTDVLSFDYGEIFISIPTARRQAKEHGVGVVAELELLFVHGLLHILGFDHQTALQKKKMIKLEGSILGYSGLVEKAVTKGTVKRR